METESIDKSKDLFNFRHKLFHSGGQIATFPEGWVAVGCIACSSAFCLVHNWQARGSPGRRWADAGVMVDVSPVERNRLKLNSLRVLCWCLRHISLEPGATCCLLRSDEGWTTHCEALTVLSITNRSQQERGGIPFLCPSREQWRSPTRAISLVTESMRHSQSCAYPHRGSVPPPGNGISRLLVVLRSLSLPTTCSQCQPKTSVLEIQPSNDTNAEA